MAVVLLSISWIFGVFLGYRLRLPPALIIAGVIPLLLLPFFRGFRRQLFFAGLVLVILAGAAIYSYYRLYHVDEDCLRFYHGQQEVELKGMVCADPDERGTSTQITIDVENLSVDGKWREVSGLAMVFVPRYPSYHYGDVLHLTGSLETPPQIGDFDYRGYLAGRGINSLMYYPRIELLGEGRGFPPLAWIYSLRERLAEAIATALPEPQASLVQGIVLGIRGNIPADLRDDFSRSGTAHLLAISGFNLAVVAGMLLAIGIGIFGRRHYIYIWLALVTIWLYALLTGMNAPVVRAAIMVSLFLVAEFLGRQRSAMVALSLAAAIMTAIHPYILGDASFQMSFLAMAGLIFISPLLFYLAERWPAGLQRGTGWLPDFYRALAGAISATLGAVIAVWPLVAYYFGIFSVIGPLATLLALPALPGIIFLGSLTGLLGLVLPALGKVTGWFAWLFVTYLTLIVRGTASGPVSALKLDGFSGVCLYIYYLLLAGLVWLFYRRLRPAGVVAGDAGYLSSGLDFSLRLKSVGKWLIVFLFVLAALMAAVAASLPDGRLRVSFLDVGEGDAILIQRGSRQILVDGGPDPGKISLALAERLPFWDRTIDLLVLTHQHQDHLSGLVEVLRRYEVRQVIYPDLDYHSPLYEEWRRLLEEKDLAGTPARAGQQVTLGDDTVLSVINPPASLRNDPRSDMDANGVVLHVRTGRVSFLLAADITADTERELVRERASLRATVLKVAHHGSDTSTSPEFLAVVCPQVAVISVGLENRHGHPAPEVVDRLAAALGKDRIYRTDENGSVDFFSDGERLWVTVEK